MTYTFISGAYANEAHTAAVVLTAEASHVAFSQADTPDDWAALLASGIVLADFSATAAEVKLEAARRIEAIMPTWMVVREWSGGASVPQSIKDTAQAIRDRSNEIEAMSPIPAGFRADSFWSAP